MDAHSDSPKHERKLTFSSRKIAVYSDGGKTMLPQIIYVAIVILGLGVELERHGKPKEGKYNFITSALVTGLVFGLLYWGGFFDAFIK